MNINIDKAFNNYIKRTFNGLSTRTLAQVLTDWMRNGWATNYFDEDTFYNDHDRWIYLNRTTENDTLVVQFVSVNETYGDIYNRKQNKLRIKDTSFTHLASCIVQEDLFLAFTRRNNPDLIETITDIVQTCPYL